MSYSNLFTSGLRTIPQLDEVDEEVPDDGSVHSSIADNIDPHLWTSKPNRTSRPTSVSRRQDPNSTRAASAYPPSTRTDYRRHPLQQTSWNVGAAMKATSPPLDARSMYSATLPHDEEDDDANSLRSAPEWRSRSTSYKRKAASLSIQAPSPNTRHHHPLPERSPPPSAIIPPIPPIPRRGGDKRHTSSFLNMSDSPLDAIRDGEVPASYSSPTRLTVKPPLPSTFQDLSRHRSASLAGASTMRREHSYPSAGFSNPAIADEPPSPTLSTMSTESKRKSRGILQRLFSSKSLK